MADLIALIDGFVLENDLEWIFEDVQVLSKFIMRSGRTAT